MIPEATQRLRSAAPLLSKATLLNDARLFGVQPRRHLNVSSRRAGKINHRPPPRDRVEIPGLEAVTYADRMHYVPGLSKPVFPRWEMGHKDPRFYRSPPHRDMALHRDEPCYVFHQRSSILEGVRQALWLTKTKLTPGLPPQLLALAESSANQIADQDERVQNAINHACFWETTEAEPKECNSSTLVHNLLQLCSSLQAGRPELGRRMLAEKYSVTASWSRGEDLFQVRGQNGLLLSSAWPLPPLADKQEVEETANHELETFYPVAPTIDLQTTHLYNPSENTTGFRSDYPYPHAHTLYFLDGVDRRCRLRPPQLRAKMIMFCFANALARARGLAPPEGPAPPLERPVCVQAVGTDGQTFQFVFFQLNTTELTNHSGVKNQVWLEEDVPLYDSARLRPLMRRKEVMVPAGLIGYRPETFRKFLSLYLHGAQ
ncbi:39S ribosomal protein L37, mitochondrial [Gadus macrocephalus]|uniref:39S ribosomal protein L37, mitochondrial n=1 Tax=Gadus macrocephalus TaxID=80720 RepID=UPI0028CB91D9|nr:39S ribosomal protein L37, mitochondrial [Gadus macrocephalus]